MTKPLDGIKIVEVAMWVYVPSAGALLADLGAEVIKIEPLTGDPLRGLTPSGFVPGGLEGFTPFWETYNRGKKSVTLNLNTDAGLVILHELLEDADVFLTSFLPDARRRLKIDIEDIKARHPDIVYAVGSGHGAFGPEAEKGGYDTISFWSRSGLAWAVTPKAAPYPLGMPSGGFGDGISGAMFAGAVNAALLQKARTGKAPVVDGSLLASGMWAMQTSITSTILDGTAEMPKRTRDESLNPLSNLYKTSDGRFIFLAMLQAQRFWPEFCAAIGRPDLIDDPRFATDGPRREYTLDLVKVLDQVFASKTLAEWRPLLDAQEGPWGPIAKVGEVDEDPQVQANAYIQDVDYGDGRSIKLVSNPFQFDRQPLPLGPAPSLGAHNDQVLAGLGYSEDEIIDLKVAGVVF